MPRITLSTVGTPKSMTLQAIAEDISIGRVLIMSYMIFMMQTGFGLLEAGACRLKNVNNILLKNLTCIALSVLVWFLWGYATGWGACGDGPMVGHTGYLLLGVSADSSDGRQDGARKDVYATWMYSWAFSATSTAIVGGAISERARFRVYALSSILMTGLVYPVVMYWVWGANGWLSSRRIDCESGNVIVLIPGTNGVLDYAGGLVVHVVGGVAALVACTLVGPRLGRYNTEGHVVDFSPNNPTHMVLGTLVFFFGFFAFNTGHSGCIIGCALTASRASVNTSLAGGSGALSALLASLLMGSPGDVYPPLFGLLTGLVSISAPGAYVEPYAAVCIGVVGGLLYLGVSGLMKQLQVDDVVETVAVHLGGGLWGTLATGLFATEYNVKQALGYANAWGLFYGGGWKQLGTQMLGIAVTLAWCSLLTLPFFGLLRRFGWLRISAAEERIGCDFAQSIGSGFPVVQWLRGLYASQCLRTRNDKCKSSDSGSVDVVNSNDLVELCSSRGHRVDGESDVVTRLSHVTDRPLLPY